MEVSGQLHTPASSDVNIKYFRSPGRDNVHCITNSMSFSDWYFYRCYCYWCPIQQGNRKENYTN